MSWWKSGWDQFCWVDAVVVTSGNGLKCGPSRYTHVNLAHVFLTYLTPDLNIRRIDCFFLCFLPWYLSMSIFFYFKSIMQPDCYSQNHFIHFIPCLNQQPVSSCIRTIPVISLFIQPGCKCLVNGSIHGRCAFDHFSLGFVCTEHGPFLECSVLSVCSMWMLVLMCFSFVFVLGSAITCDEFTHIENE